MFCQVAGVRHSNSDGISRQTFVRDVKVADVLGLRRERDNPHDPNAIKVLTHLEKQIGYLPREVAKLVCDCADKGWQFDCVVMKRDRRRDDESSPPVYFLDIMLLGAPSESCDLYRDLYCGSVLKNDIRNRYPKFPVRKFIPD
ncbi:MAG: HIRAN domain-containing protein [Rhodopirellula sp.]|nr:HIRAN domain-containing protein [Rhodopirellula sp.]